MVVTRDAMGVNNPNAAVYEDVIFTCFADICLK